MPQPLLLLLDDSPEMGLLVASLGRRAGCEVTVCADAEKASAALARRRPDLVLLDVNLPGESGPDWLRRVRAAAEFADLPVALYTHWGLPSDIAAGLAAGVDFMFDKDLASRPADWGRRLNEILAVRKVGQGENPGPAWPNAAASSRMEDGVGGARPPKAWATAINLALRRPSLRRLTREVAPVLLRRALTQAFLPGTPPEDAASWIRPDGAGFDGERLPPFLATEMLPRLAACLTDQIGRLLGKAAAAAFRDAAAAAFPAVSEESP